MNLIVTAFKQLIGLFVEDGTLALLLIIWVGIAALALPRMPIDSAWDGVILFAGCVAILIENVVRAARRA
jgi:hypothetical protein